MGFMDKVSAKLATKYGTVYKGKHIGCQVALGNPPNKKVELANSFSQIIFVDGTEEKGRYDIKTDLIGMGLLSYNERAFQILVGFTDDDYCLFNLDIRQEDKPMVGMVKGLLGQKNTLNASPKEALELQHRGVKVFLQNTAYYFTTEEHLQTFRNYFLQLDILDESTKKALDIALEHAKALDALIATQED